MVAQSSIEQTNIMFSLRQEKELLYKKFLREGKITDPRVLKSFLKVPREDFLPPDKKLYAYDDNPLPIGKGQTISQPTTVLLMLQWLEIKPGQKIMEIGAGSGYQAALLSHLVGQKGRIIAIEIIKELADTAQKNLRNYKNVTVLHHDGSQGYQTESLYDRIIIAAAAPTFPVHLLKQLKKDGILLAPVGREEQDMIRVRKGHLPENLGEFLFVPLTGKMS